MSENSLHRYSHLFAQYYDYLVHDRREALATDEDMAFITEAFAARVTAGVQDVLDAGCGAGRYLVPLAQQGFRVAGVDVSPDMLAVCAARLRQRGLTAQVREGDLLALQEKACYDAVLCMNSVLCNFLETETILHALAVFREALRPGGMLILEIWNILANTASFDSTTTHQIRDDAVEITYTSTNRYEPFRSIYREQLAVQVTDHGRQHAFTHEEVLRVMTVGEVMAYVQAAGFVDVAVVNRPDTLEPDSGDEELVFLATRPAA